MTRARFDLTNASVFVKCLALVAGTTLLVATLLSVLNVRTLNGAIDDGIRTLGREITASAASSNAAALRFGNAEAVEESLAYILANSDGAARRGLAIDAQGGTVATLGDGSDPAASGLGDLAVAALRSASVQVSDDGFSIAVPARAGAAGGGITGVIAVAWTPEHGRAAARTGQWLGLGLSAMLLCVLLYAASQVLRALVSRPISVLANEIVTLRDGRYDADVPFTDRRDEIGAIARNLTELQGQLSAAARGAKDRARIEAEQKVVVERLTTALQTVAMGDLTQCIDTPFAPDYEPLRQNFNETVATFVRVIEQVAGNSRTILASAGDIARSSDDLSARTENQAASLEETAAALNMITTNVESAAASAQNVERIVGDARGRALESSSVVKQTVEAMARIEDSSRQISRITTVIDEIAFQTNLLALNAGVEAARAGEAGRGFSVVANEVRALAQRSSDAANEIKGLIGESSAHVDRGVELVANAGEELRQITESVSTISTHVEGISRSAREQSSSLAEINVGVAQLDRVTQQNAAMVAQANDAGRTLRDEATAMAESISVFRLPNRGLSADTGRRVLLAV